jgi:ABC-2 type transport system ATP-binding protein
VNPTIETRNLSKWYGNVLGLSDVTLAIEPGITGLLGPNGAGKSTFMKLLTGQLKPNIGEVAVLGRRVRNAYPLFAKIGFCPESDAFYEEITGWEFLTGLLSFYGYSRDEARDRAAKALDIVELTAGGSVATAGACASASGSPRPSPTTPRSLSSTSR